MTNAFSLLRSRALLVLLWLCLGGLYGCQSATTLSMAVRTGDTVLIGLGGEPEGPVSNLRSEVLRSDNLQALIIDSAGRERVVRVRSVFRVFGDPTANPLAAQRGQWLAVIDLVGADDAPLDLNTGDAVLRISSGRLKGMQEINTTILDGTGTPHPLLGKESDLPKLGFLEPARQSLVSLRNTGGAVRVGAVQLDFHVDEEDTQSALGLLSAIDAVKLQGDRAISFLTWRRPGAGGGTDLTVVMTAPDGVDSDELHLFDVALVSGLISRAAQPRNYFTGALQRARIYNIDGERISGVNVVVGAVL